MDSKLINACAGKSASKGGLNVSDLFTIAKQGGYNGSKKRADLIAFLCGGAPAPAPVSKAKKASASRPKQPAPMVKVTKTKTHGTKGRLSAKTYYDTYGKAAVGHVCDIRGDGELKCLLLNKNGTPRWAKVSKSGAGQEACGAVPWKSRCNEQM